ncbi:MAG TPA: response regulator [Vicinamibacterales bacterium]|jgi:CheY-like chemotaxis protein|nr:response regulator [Vicinamibacterales bacterium]
MTVLLLVQVDVDNRERYAAFLRRDGFLPIPVATAGDALRLAPHADVIVTETLLPGRMDGFEFIARLKGDERTKAIPVIVLTVCAWQAERERAKEAGCDAFLARPCPPDVLVREVRRVLEPSQLRDVHGATTGGDLPNELAERHALAAGSTRSKRSR